MTTIRMNTCDMCAPYDRPGFVYNASQWVKCWQCNQQDGRAKVIDSVKPFNVRASCGHIVIRKMREATAGVAYTPDVILDAPFGRACPSCEGEVTA